VARRSSCRPSRGTRSRCARKTGTSFGATRRSRPRWWSRPTAASSWAVGPSSPATACGWCLPGGYVNDDEHPAEAAARECLEEIGAEVEIVRLLGVYHIAKTTASSIIGIAYRGRLVDGESISAGPEMLEVAVFSPDELPQVAFPSHQAVLSAYVRSPAQQGGAELLNAGAAAQPASQPSPVREAPRRQHKR